MDFIKLRNYLIITFVWFGFAYIRISYHLGGVALVATGYVLLVCALLPGKIRFAASEKELVKATAWFLFFCLVCVLLYELWGEAKYTKSLGLFEIALDSFNIINLFPICLAFLLMFRNDHNKNSYCIFVTCLLLYDICVTLMALSVDEEFSRFLAAGSTSAQTMPYRLMGAMGYELTYSVVLLIPLLFVYGYQKKKLICCIVAGIGVIYVFQSAFTLAIIIMIMNVGLAFLFLVPHSTIRKLLLFVIVLLGTVLLINGEWIGRMLQRLSGTIQILPIKQRTEDLANLFLFGDSTGGSLNRISLYLHDLSAIVHSPILGMTILNPSYQNGGHSTIMDLWSSFGLIAVVPFIQTVRHMYLYCTEGLSPKVKGVVWATYVSFFTLSTFNPVLASPHILVAILWLVPMLAKSLVIDTLDIEHP